MNHREKIREQLNPLYIPYYDRLCSKLPDEWQPYSGMRTFEAQDALYAEGRTAPGGEVTNARGGESAHNYGCATDWTIWDESGKPVWMKKEDPRWKIYVDAVSESGLRPGLEFGDIDHNELRISVDWPVILAAHKMSGPSGADTAIETAMVYTGSILNLSDLPGTAV